MTIYNTDIIYKDANINVVQATLNMI